jgi:ATP-binding cassette, subfamily B, multidrug efflux pump
MLKILKFLKPYTTQVIFILLLMFIQTLSDLYLPTLMAKLVDVGIINGDSSYIIRTGAFMLLVAAGGAISSICASFLSSRTSLGMARKFREKVFTRVESFSLNEFNKLGTSTLIVRTTNDITQIQQVVVMMLRMMLTAPLMFIGGIIMAYSEDKYLTLLLLGAVPFLAALMFFIAKKGFPLFKLMQIKLDKLNQILREGLTGIRVIRAFNREEYQSKRFDEANKDLMQNAIKVNKIMAFLLPAIMLIMNLTILAILWFGGIRIESGAIQVGSLMAFIQYAMMIMFSMVMVTMIFVIVPRAEAAADRINEVLDLTVDIKDPESPKTGDGPKGNIEFIDVSFTYPGASEPALCNISFRTGPGEMTAIIGGTGSGKSTLINLIPRLYDVLKGSILVDGTDVRELSQGNLRSKIGFVPQKSVLFTGTISDNIRYGKKEASFEEIVKAAETAQAVEFISELKDGYEHMVSQGGSNFSGGQKQRLSIARALVKKPEILIFDDSFSALDFKTDAKLRAALRRETAGATVLIVTQRVATVMNADRIIVLDEGAIACVGTHKELMKNCEVYREIVKSQLSEEESA